MRVAVDAMILPFCFPDKNKSFAPYTADSNTVSAGAFDEALRVLAFETIVDAV
jgi:hypothetical protein